ncbi:uncharacterized protein LOC141690394 [Apium graveolens]|uniref:uncharacterized protein LOC141690394 n=1 Tax=Apium graveolens TaxID=4045 RepID=UPI003D7A2FBD
MGQPKVLCDVMYDRNPRVFLDIEIGGVHAGRMIFELFADTSPKATEYFGALCTGENGIGKKGKALCYKGTSISVLYIWVDRRFVHSRGDLFFNKGCRWFNIGFREYRWWDDTVFGKILHGMDVLVMVAEGLLNV